MSGGADFSSDVGRKKFGFSHEDIDDSTGFYEGQFKLHMRCGEGTLQNLETGSKYVGQFQNDKFHGKGEHVWPDGSRYAGTWKEGQKHGRGTYVSCDELTYEGQFQNGKRHGQGRQEYANGDFYEGWWYDGMHSGIGTYFFADGGQFQGTWSVGRYDGPGIMYGADHSRERLTYTHGLLAKREVLPPGPVPKLTNRARPTFYGKLGEVQHREIVMQNTLMAENHPSPFLIKRETATMDLSAPAIRKPKPRAMLLEINDSNFLEGGGSVDDLQKPILDGVPENLAAGHEAAYHQESGHGVTNLTENGTFFTQG
eukprot:TRINITY_DN54513_c0_g1_i1.p1 TRINITY_DN54513_c0_g1~~TRINITY_DN54513_c0_g1_i1.p1  ORF type:complete len:329 (+),score=63.37 TRINITY_DN54513_c0_g1_i1:53-988(+)